MHVEKSFFRFYLYFKLCKKKNKNKKNYLEIMKELTKIFQKIQKLNPVVVAQFEIMIVCLGQI